MEYHCYTFLLIYRLLMVTILLILTFCVRIILQGRLRISLYNICCTGVVRRLACLMSISHIRNGLMIFVQRSIRLFPNKRCIHFELTNQMHDKFTKLESQDLVCDRNKHQHILGQVFSNMP